MYIFIYVFYIYIYIYIYIYVVSQVALVVKNPSANAGDAGGWVGSLGGDDPLEEEVATLSSILAWEIPWTLQFSCSVVCNSLRPPGLQHARIPCSAPTPGVYSNLSIESAMTSNHLILCRPLLLLPSIFPSIRVYSNG